VQYIAFYVIGFVGFGLGFWFASCVVANDHVQQLKEHRARFKDSITSFLSTWGEK
jgi:hypothetical protein